MDEMRSQKDKMEGGSLPTPLTRTQMVQAHKLDDYVGRCGLSAQTGRASRRNGRWDDRACSSERGWSEADSRAGCSTTKSAEIGAQGKVIGEPRGDEDVGKTLTNVLLTTDGRKCSSRSEKLWDVCEKQGTIEEEKNASCSLLHSRYSR